MYKVIIMTRVKMNHKTTTTLSIVTIAVVATLLAAGTVVIASNHFAFAWKHKDRSIN